MTEKNLAELRGPWKRELANGHEAWATVYVTALGNKLEAEHMTEAHAREWMEIISKRDGVHIAPATSSGSAPAPHGNAR